VSGPEPAYTRTAIDALRAKAPLTVLRTAANARSI
jgi:hypothetical protein